MVFCGIAQNVVIVLRMLALKKNRHINALTVEMVGNKGLVRWQNDYTKI